MGGQTYGSKSACEKSFTTDSTLNAGTVVWNNEIKRASTDSDSIVRGFVHIYNGISWTYNKAVVPAASWSYKNAIVPTGNWIYKNALDVPSAE